MGSFQQICLGAICLAAAYMFGNYVNNNPPLNPDTISSAAGISGFNSVESHKFASNIAGNIQSRLPISEFPSFENKPAPIVTMKTPLKSRFSVPVAQQHAAPVELFGRTPQYNNQLPPPSQLAAPRQLPAPSQLSAPNQLPAPSQLAAPYQMPAASQQQSASVFDAPFSTRPFAEPAAVSPTIQVPDFSAIAAEFKNTPIELPNMSRLGDMPSHSNLSYQEPNQFGNWQHTNRSNKRLKQLVRSLPDNGFRNPNLQHPRPEEFNRQRPYQMNTQQDFEPENRPMASSNGFSQADFEPKLNEDIFGLKTKPNRFDNRFEENRFEENRFENVTRRNNERFEAANSTGPSGGFQFEYDHVPPPAPGPEPEPEYYDNDRTTSGFRGNLTFRPELENRYRDSINQPQPVQSDYERQMQLDRRSQLERQMQAERERELAAERRQMQAERERQVEAERQMQYERQMQAERERQMQAERERQLATERRQIQTERERELEAEQQYQRQMQDERERQLATELRQIQTEREREIEAERQYELQMQAERERQIAAERQLRAEQERRLETERQVQTNRPTFNNRSTLPFRLTDQAQTELVQLRERADSMIGSESTNFVDHTIQNGETLQSISQRYFGSPNYYLDIYLANRNKLRNPADAQTGVSIRVPVYNSN